MDVKFRSSGGNICKIFQEMHLGEKKKDITLATEWLNEHRFLDCWINGKFLRSTGENSYSVLEFEGSTTKVLEGIHCVDVAVESSISAQGKWEKETPQIRLDILFKIANALQSKRELFLQLNHLPAKFNDFQLFVDYFNYYSDLVIDDYEKWRPGGVLYVILSRESPLWILAMIVASALSTGCSVIVKPSSKNPFSPFLLAQLCTNVGLPNGLLNVVPGSRATSEEFLSKNINEVIFCGNHTIGTFIGIKIPHKRFSFLNTHHTASIILESGDIQGAADKLFAETWDSIKRTAWGVEVVVVQESIYNDFLQKFTKKIESYNEEPEKPLDTADGISEGKLFKIVPEAKRMGVTIIYRHTTQDNQVRGPVLVNEYQMDCSDSQIPIMTLLVCRTASEAVDLINNFSYCLATSIWTEKLSEAMEAASQLESSTVWINCHGVMGASVTFEPSRNSGIGCFGGLGGAISYMTGDLLDEQKIPSGTELQFYLSNKLDINQTLLSSSDSFSKWKFERNRKRYLKEIFNSILQQEELSKYGVVINYWALNTNVYAIEKSYPENYLHVAESKAPLGVISIIINDPKNVFKTFISLVSPAIALGNAVIVVVDEENFLRLKIMAECFIKNLPTGLVNLVKSCYVYDLVAETNIKAIWFYDASSTMSMQRRELKKISLKFSKRFWVPPIEVPESKILFWKHALKYQTVWFTKVHRCTSTI